LIFESQCRFRIKIGESAGLRRTRSTAGPDGSPRAFGERPYISSLFIYYHIITYIVNKLFWRLPRREPKAKEYKRFEDIKRVHGGDECWYAKEFPRVFCIFIKKRAD
jgi:hypothetical protein